MALDARYIPINLLNDYYVDKDSALPLANGELRFFRDTSRATPKKVFELSNTNGTYTYTELPNPVQLSSVGTAVNATGTQVAVYTFPFISDPVTNQLQVDLYYVEAYNSGSQLQWTREAIPNIEDIQDILDTPQNASNQLSNPQFSNYFIEDAATTIPISAANTVVPIAPDWDLVASGNGNIIVTRVPVEGNEAIPTYPAYYLSINVGTGVTNPRLRQRLKQNSGLWSGRFLSGFFAAKVNSDTAGVTMKYRDSSGTTNNVTIFTGNPDTSWNIYSGSSQIGNSSNTQSGDNAFVDIEIELPTDKTTDITSLQVLVSDTELVADVSLYDARSANRDQALMGDYYIPRLSNKQIPSLLTGWDFPLNPAQFGVSGTVGSGTAQYIWDQTILQTSSGASINYFRESNITLGLGLVHNNADQSFALIQYLDRNNATKVTLQEVSVNIDAFTRNNTNPAQDTVVQVKIFYNESAVQFGSLPTTIVDLATDGTITLTGTAASNGWVELGRKNLPVAKGSIVPATTTEAINQRTDLKFNGWERAPQRLSQGIAVVVSFTPAASSTVYSTVVSSISLTPGSIPTRPGAQTKNEVLRECQYYYESSYPLGTAPGTGGLVGIAKPQAESVFSASLLSNKAYFASPFDYEYQSVKRAFPSVSLYSKTGGTANAVDYNAQAVDATTLVTSFTEVTVSTHWTLSRSEKHFLFTPRPANPLSVVTLSTGFGNNISYSYIEFHTTIDARLGVV